jgi:MFS transporter, DHA1 family, multidrug resistance protein
VPSTAPRRRVGRFEFVTLIASAMALGALGIDLMLPAFAMMRADLGLPPGSPAIAGLVTSYFLGLAAGQLVYGPLSDRFGRRAALFVGFAIYILGALAAAVAPSLTWLLVGRFVWGVGAAGARVVTIAMVRDRFVGEEMSRAMSFIFSVFILVPVIAPTIGAAVVAVTSWRRLFVACAVVAAVVTVWAVRRLPETLPVEHQLELRFGRIARAAREVVSHRSTAGYAVAMTALYASFVSYLGSSEAIVAEVFGVPDRFPIIFGGLASMMGLSMLVNARIVGRVGLRRLAHATMIAYLAAAGLLAGLALVTGGRPPLALFLVSMALMLAAQAMLLPNLNTIAMGPMAHIAGTASSVIGSVQLAVGASIGAVIDRAFDGTVLPLALSFLGFGIAAAACIAWVEGRALFEPEPIVIAASE